LQGDQIMCTIRHFYRRRYYLMQHLIKSFVLRQGRTSPRQLNGVEELPRYEVSAGDGPIDLEMLFGREAPTVIEIGFGMGASLTTMAKAYPETNFIGIEVHKPGVGSLVADLMDEGITNVRIVNGDAVSFITTRIDPQTLSGVQIFFPDPWPKKRHHKRRLIQAPFISLLTEKLAPGGFIHCATDWEDYAHQMLEVLSANPLLKNCAADGAFIERPETRPVTKFERRGERLGHGVWDVKFNVGWALAQQ